MSAVLNSSIEHNDHSYHSYSRFDHRLGIALVGGMFHNWNIYLVCQRTVDDIHFGVASGIHLGHPLDLHDHGRLDDHQPQPDFVFLNASTLTLSPALECIFWASFSDWMIASTRRADCRQSLIVLACVISFRSWSCTCLWLLWIRKRNFTTSSWFVKPHSFARLRSFDMKSDWSLQWCECKAPRLYQLWIIDWSGVKWASKTSRTSSSFSRSFLLSPSSSGNMSSSLKNLLTSVSHPVLQCGYLRFLVHGRVRSVDQQ